MRVLIVEDENLTARRLEGQLLKYDPSIEVLAKLPSVAKAVDWLRTHPAPDLLFLDIHLEDDLGFRIFEQVQVSTPVIFTTAYDEYMIQAFKVNSIDYLLKPVNYDDLVAAIEKYKALRQHFAAPDLSALLQLVTKPSEQAYRDRFMVSIGPKLRSVEVSDIAYFFLEEKVVFLTTQQGSMLPLEYSLDKLTQLLNPRQFFRVSRQYLVSLGSIDSIHTYSAGKLRLELRPTPRHEVFVSGDRVTDFKDWLGR
ncbi:LytR/AlgR family response regulator transcription factor [Hymenobacter crusticola]|uniref:DNA-binding response regulator n=1 Tax=Hymenobacter crusticola TaxID=1770526 RepID=A0A243WED1_9BACT|nr:LytTR family DNA-binding domain-containing protein [Hymenobacter crusticola]OUJ74094.1 DNA-binding response regulator [Hymenobacter crusticola]